MSANVPGQQAELLQRGLRAHRAGDLGEAERFYQKLHRLAPRDFNALHLLGVVNAQRRRFDVAERFLSQAVALAPRPEALNNFGSVLTELGRAPEAIVRLRQAIRAKTDYPEAHFNLGNALRRTAQTDQAISSYRTALSLRPSYVEALQNLSDALREAGRQREAIDALRQAIALQPGSAVFHNNLGVALRDIGELEEARAAFDRAIALDQRFTTPYYHRVRTGKIAAGDAIIGAMEAIKADSAGQSGEARSMLLFALAKAYDDTGDYDRAFASLLAANTGAREAVAYDEAADSRAFREIEQGIGASFLAERSSAGVASELPIFVVGFPRSGTTLVEQILASHPAAHGAGEIAFLEQALIESGGDAILTAAPQAGIGMLRQAGLLYLERLARLAPSASRITDKNSGNSLLAGFIHLMLPRARIVHVRRDPLDACLSCFFQRFAGDSCSFAYDLGELGRRYRRYEHIMEHWQRILPPGAILPIRYEDLATNLEPEVRRLLDFCGLPWDERCLSFHSVERAVRTASAAQVRQPIYRSSIERWRRYERFLGPLIEAIGEPVPAAPGPTPRDERSPGASG